MLARAQSFTATREAFFAPALAYAARVYDPDYRYHVVTPVMHWESYYFPAAGLPITRGWYRQADALHNGGRYDEDLDAAGCASWLRRVGVEYVFVPHAPLVSTSQREARLLAASDEFGLAYRDPGWTVYRLLASEPLVVPPAQAGAQVYTMDHTSVRFRVTRPGPYLVKVTWSPFWRLARQPASQAQRGRDDRAGELRRSDALEPGDQPLSKDPCGFIVFEAPSVGVYELRFDVAGTAQAELTQ